MMPARAYSGGPFAFGPASPPCVGCWRRPCLIASTMMLAPIPTVTMPATIRPVTQDASRLRMAVMSPNPELANTVTVKQNASVRDSDR
jgi:hypothetical protein